MTSVLRQKHLFGPVIARKPDRRNHGLADYGDTTPLGKPSEPFDGIDLLDGPEKRQVWSLIIFLLQRILLGVSDDMG